MGVDQGGSPLMHVSIVREYAYVRCPWLSFAPGAQLALQPAIAPLDQPRLCRHHHPLPHPPHHILHVALCNVGMPAARKMEDTFSDTIPAGKDTLGAIPLSLPLKGRSANSPPVPPDPTAAGDTIEQPLESIRRKLDNAFEVLMSWRTPNPGAESQKSTNANSPSPVTTSASTITATSDPNGGLALPADSDAVRGSPLAQRAPSDAVGGSPLAQRAPYSYRIPYGHTARLNSQAAPRVGADGEGNRRSPIPSSPERIDVWQSPHEA